MPATRAIAVSQSPPRPEGATVTRELPSFCLFVLISAVLIGALVVAVLAIARAISVAARLLSDELNRRPMTFTDAAP
jgi:hypothetical protein